MARSDYIYIAVQRLGYDYSDDPVGVWTVKKEMLDEGTSPAAGLDLELERRTDITDEVNELLTKRHSRSP